MKKDTSDHQLQLFAPSFPTSIAVKDQQDLMQYPFFSLSKRKRVSPIKYKDKNVEIQVIAPQETGLANIFDADILIYAASQLMEAQNKNLPTSPEIKVSKYEILEFLGKTTDGRGYQRLKASLRRLKATSVETTIRAEDGKRGEKMFGWLEDFTIIERNDRPVGIRLTLPQWLYKGIIEHRLVLTLDRQYFRLEGGLERFLYRLCRKIIGENGQLQMKLTTIHKRSGSPEKPGKFRKALERAIEDQTIPGYWVFFATRTSTGDDYLCGHPKKKYKTLDEAIAHTSFLAMDRALIKPKDVPPQ